MAFICPDCNGNSLHIEDTLALTPGADDDELMLQTVACRRCGFRGLAVYRESRRGALDSESWWHDGYHVSPADYWAVREAIRFCPEGQSAACRCAAHRKLGAIDGNHWNGLRRSGIVVKGSFAMRRGE